MHHNWNSQKSLDDNDVMRIISSGSFGWYDEFSSDDSGSLYDFNNDGVKLIEDWRTAESSKHSWVVNDIPEFFERRSEHITTSKTFRGNSANTPVAYTVAIRAIRVMTNGGGHAQYEVVLTAGGSEMQCWKRFNDFKLLSEYAKISEFKEAVLAWTDLQQMQRWFRCLDVNYLRRKCMLLERFLAQLLFELHTPSLLLTFVGISKRSDSGQSRKAYNWRR